MKHVSMYQAADVKLQIYHLDAAPAYNTQVLSSHFDHVLALCFVGDRLFSGSLDNRCRTAGPATCAHVCSILFCIAAPCLRPLTHPPTSPRSIREWPLEGLPGAHPRVVPQAHPSCTPPCCFICSVFPSPSLCLCLSVSLSIDCSISRAACADRDSIRGRSCVPSWRCLVPVGRWPWIPEGLSGYALTGPIGLLCHGAGAIS